MTNYTFVFCVSLRLFASLMCVRVAPQVPRPLRVLAPARRRAGAARGGRGVRGGAVRRRLVRGGGRGLRQVRHLPRELRRAPRYSTPHNPLSCETMTRRATVNQSHAYICKQYFLHVINLHL